MTITTFHLDLSPQPDSSEVGVSSEAQQMVVPDRGEKVFEQEERALKRMLTHPTGLDPEHTAGERQSQALKHLF